MKTSTWWGTFALDYMQTGQWQIGPLKLAAQRLAHEWQVAFEAETIDDFAEDEWSYATISQPVVDLNYATTERYSFTDPGDNICLMPLLADRSMVIRPQMPFHVVPGERATLFVSSPLWIRLAAGNPQAQLREIAIQRPSDTWFGSSTADGELCYASRTKGRLNFENVSQRFHRAITQVVVQNQAASMLTVERLILPVPYLSLFSSANGLLWTESVTMVRFEDTSLADFQIESDPLQQASDAQLINGPRQKPERGMIMRAFGILFKSQ